MELGAYMPCTTCNSSPYCIFLHTIILLLDSVIKNRLKSSMNMNQCVSLVHYAIGLSTHCCWMHLLYLYMRWLFKINYDEWDVNWSKLLFQTCYKLVICVITAWQSITIDGFCRLLSKTEVSKYKTEKHKKIKLM